MLVLICNLLLDYKLPSLHCAVRAAESKLQNPSFLALCREGSGKKVAKPLLPRTGGIKRAICSNGQINLQFTMLKLHPSAWRPEMKRSEKSSMATLFLPHCYLECLV